MKLASRRLWIHWAALGCVAWGAGRARADDFFDRLDAALTVSALQDQFRARVSGAFELEGYHFDQPAPALIYTEEENLVNPRLTLFVDAQLGSTLYGFAQIRADRGFDPSENGAEVRLDEFALRVSPWGGRLNLQVGKFATMIGNWIPRHAAWENPFVTAPLPYENLTGIWDVKAPKTNTTLFDWAHVGPFGATTSENSEKRLRTPVIWGPSYTRGAAIFGRVEQFRYAFELKSASLSSHPETWKSGEDHWRHPTVSGRIGYQPNEMWNFGVSASGGTYLRSFATPTLAPGHSLGEYRETVFGQDLSFAWHHWQVWAEVFEARFAIPNIGDADTLSYYTEVKYKLTPRLFGAVRWNQQWFDTLPNGTGGQVHWGRDTWRIDLAPTYRFTPHLQLKLQYSLQHESNGPDEFRHLLATQLSLRF